MMHFKTILKSYSYIVIILFLNKFIYLDKESFLYIFYQKTLTNQQFNLIFLSQNLVELDLIFVLLASIRLLCQRLTNNASMQFKLLENG
jgi:hypothetical protein